MDQDIIPDKECTQGIGHDMIEDDFEINGDGIDYMAIEDDSTI